MFNGTGDVRREFRAVERDEVEQLLKLSFSMSDQLLHSMSTHTFPVVQIQVIIFNSDYSIVGQPDRSEILLIPKLFHNCTCIHVFYSVRHTTLCDIYTWTLVHSLDHFYKLCGQHSFGGVLAILVQRAAIAIAGDG